MATLQQLEAALIKADAAGNVEDARILAAAIRRMRGGASSQQQGFGKSFVEGLTTLGAAPAAIGFGVADTPEARQALIEAQSSEGQRTSWEDVKDLPSFVDWAKQTAGQSLGYIAAPAALGTAASTVAKVAGAVPGPIGRAVGIGALGAQYLTENLGRQASEQEVAEQEGRAVRPANIGAATLAAAGQTGLDVAGFKFFKPLFGRFPFLKSLVDASEDTAEKSAKTLLESLKKGDLSISSGIAAGVAKGIAFEIPQEVAQTVLERAQAGLSLGDEDARREYGEAIAGAVLLGGGFGSISGGVEAAADIGTARNYELGLETKAKTEAKERLQKTESEEVGNISTADATPEQIAAAAAAAATASRAPAAPGTVPAIKATERTKLILQKVKEWADINKKEEERKKQLLKEEERKKQPDWPDNTGRREGLATYVNGQLGKNLYFTERNNLEKLGFVVKDDKTDTFTITPEGLQFLGLGVSDATREPDPNRTGTGNAVPAPEEAAAAAAAVAANNARVGTRGKGTKVVNGGKKGGESTLTEEQIAIREELRLKEEERKKQLLKQAADAAIQAKKEFELRAAAERRAENKVDMAALAEQNLALTAPFGMGITQAAPQETIRAKDLETTVDPVEEQRRQIEAKRAEYNLKVIDVIKQNGASVPAIAKGMGIGRDAAANLRNRFIKEGILVEDKKGKAVLNETAVSKIVPPAERQIVVPQSAAASIKRQSQIDPTINDILLNNNRSPKGKGSAINLVLDHIRTKNVDNAFNALAKLIQGTVTEAVTEDSGPVKPVEKGFVTMIDGTKIHSREELQKFYERSAARGEALPSPELLSQITKDLDAKIIAYRGEFSKERGIGSFKPRIILEGAEDLSPKEIKLLEEVKNNGDVAGYDYRQNALIFTKEGLTDKTVMHEVLHAYTTEVLERFLKNKQSLNAEQKKGAETIVRIFNESKDKLKNKYPKAYENVKEFVAYAMTEPEFQADLANIKISLNEAEELAIISKNIGLSKRTELAKEIGVDARNSPLTLWNRFTRAVARMLFGGIPQDERQAKENALLQLTEAVEEILTVPQKPKNAMELYGRRRKSEKSYLPAGARVTAPTATPVHKSREELRQDTIDNSTGGNTFNEDKGTMIEGLKEIFQGAGMERWIEKLQDSRRLLKTLQDQLIASKKIKYAGNDQNALYDLLALATQRADFAMARYFRQPMSMINDGINKYSEKKGMSVKDTFKWLGMLFVARNELERRQFKYLEEVPLNNDQIKQISINLPPNAIRPDTELAKALSGVNTPWGFRQKLLEAVMSNDEYTSKDLAVAKAVLKMLVDNYKDAAGDTGYTTPGKKVKPENAQSVFDINSTLYSVHGYKTAEEWSNYRDALQEELSDPETSEYVDQIWNAMQVISDNSSELNAGANYRTQGVTNRINFMGYKFYVPFKGTLGYDTKGKSDYDYSSNDLTSTDEAKVVENLGEKAKGRATESDNAIIQMMHDGVVSAIIDGRKGITQAIYNLVKDGWIPGYLGKDKKSKTPNIISLQDRHMERINMKELGGPNKFFHHLENGDIQIITINNDTPYEKAVLQAIKRSYQPPSFLTNTFNRITSNVGFLHTRYNPWFHPYNFVRDVLFNAYLLGIKQSPYNAVKYIADVAKRSMGSMGKAGRISALYKRNRIDEIEKLAREDKSGQYQDLYDYLKLGGRVAFIQGVAAEADYETLMGDISPGGFAKSRKAIDSWVDTYSDLFELTSRASAYHVSKAFYMSQEGGGMDEEAAKVRAAADAKNLANFELVGQYGKQAGALFMFFRPAATGAVAAWDAVRPAWTSEEDYKNTLSKNILEDPTALNNAMEDFRRRKTNAIHITLGVAGAGAALYMMALFAADGDDDKDDQGRNKVAIDDMAVWTRNLRLPLSIFGIDKENKQDYKFLNIPWGFGIGALGAAGAQVAALGAGNQSFGDFTNNMISISLDSYMPAPVSRMNFLDNPSAWLVDTLTPSIGRPFVQYAMNIDGLGRSVFHDRPTKYGDAYSGGDYVPEQFRSAAIYLADISNGEINLQPSTLSHFANNYLDGLSKITSMLYGLSEVASGGRKLDVKNDVPLIGSFIGKKTSYDGRQYAEVTQKIENMRSTLNMFENTNDIKGWQRYNQRHPNALMLVEIYNKTSNGYLKIINQKMNEVRANKQLTSGQRKEILDNMKLIQNRFKRQLIDTYKQLGVEPD